MCQSTEAAPAAIRFEPGDQEQGDLLLLASLKRDGLDFERGAEVGCFLELPELGGARAAARDLRCGGWATEVHVAGDGLAWVLLAERHMVLSWVNVAAMGATMNAVALRHGGAYDGWGVSAP